MENADKRLVLTGFMGVGKSTVACHLSRLTGQRRIDLDDFIERSENLKITEIIQGNGIDYFRSRETDLLARVLDETNAGIISLGGGAWTTQANRDMIRERGYTTIWLESTFEHCWRNIRRSYKKRPLAENKDEAKRLFEEREKLYCLADWHFVIDPGHGSVDVARQIAIEVCSVDLK